MSQVLHIITDTNIGGAGNYLLNFLDFVQKYDEQKKYDFEVLIPHQSLLGPELARRGIPVTEVPYIGDTSMNVKAINGLRRLFQEKKPDIVHTHAALSARIAARLYGKCKIVHTRHSVFDVPGWQKAFPFRQILGGLNNWFSDAIIAVSPAARDNLLEMGTDGRKIHVVNNGIRQTEKLSAEAVREIRQKYGLNDSDFVVAVMARMVAEKGQEDVLDAAKILAGKDSSIQFVLAGTGERESHIRERIRQESIGNVQYIGFIHDIGGIENMMDLQLNASYGTEATSLSLLEGMSLGKPAVASDFGGNPYVIMHNENGLIFQKRNVKAMADAILSLRKNEPFYRQCGQNALQIFAEKYTVQTMVRKTLDVYDAACRNIHDRFTNPTDKE